MSARRPPDILRKSHRHVGRKERAQAKATLERELSALGDDAREAAFLIDLDGVIYEAGAPVPGARETINWLSAQQMPRLFLTNTTSKPRAAIAEQLARMEIDVRENDILTPPAAAVPWLRDRAPGPVALFVPPATRAEFSALPTAQPGSPAAAVVVGDYGENWSFAELNRAFRLLMTDPKPVLVALGMTRYWKAADGLRLDTAPFVVALAHAAGVEPVVLGKPSAEFFASALTRLGVTAEHAWMIGDDIRGDIRGAQEAGLRGILVKTGKFRPGDLDLGIDPALTLDSIGDLPDAWGTDG